MAVSEPTSSSSLLSGEQETSSDLEIMRRDDVTMEVYTEGCIATSSSLTRAPSHGRRHGVHQTRRKKKVSVHRVTNED